MLRFVPEIRGERPPSTGEQLFEVEDSTFGEAGMVGLWTKADSVSEFDDVRYGETN
jgi:hypothetical protein